MTTKRPTPVGATPSELELDAVMLRVGRLNYAWSNTESLLIHMIAGLSGVTKDVAVVIFLTVNSARGRVELVERLAKLILPVGQQQKQLLELTARFSRLQAVRNRYNHSIWSFEEDGSMSTILMRIADRRDRIHMGRKQNLSENEMDKLDQNLEALSSLNGEMWQFLQQYNYPIG